LVLFLLFTPALLPSAAAPLPHRSFSAPHILWGPKPSTHLERSLNERHGFILTWQRHVSQPTKPCVVESAHILCKPSPSRSPPEHVTWLQLELGMTEGDMEVSSPNHAWQADLAHIRKNHFSILNNPPSSCPAFQPVPCFPNYRELPTPPPNDELNSGRKNET
jgi:hypothetical protein